MGTKSFFNMFSAALLALSLASCDEVEYFNPPQYNDAGVPSLTLSEKTLTLEAQTGEAAVQVQSNVSWSAASDADWCEVNPPSNRGNSRLLIRYSTNPSIIRRTAKITVSAGENLASVLTVTQPGAPLVSPTDYEAGVARTSFKITIKAEGPWSSSVESEGGWCSLQQSEGSGISENTIDVQSNYTGAPRTASIEVVCGDNRTVLTVRQAGELVAPQLQLTNTGDALQLSWTPVKGAIAYNILAVSGSGTVASAEVEAGVTNYDLDVNQEVFFAGYTGPATLQVEAVTADSEIRSMSEATTQIHSHFGPESGDGTSADKAFVVSGIRHLRNISRFVGTYCYYKQNVDITLPVAAEGASNFMPIQDFLGAYDGGGHSISGMALASASGNCGFIGSTAAGSEAQPVTLAHLTLTAVRVRSTATGAAPTAALVGNTAAWCSIDDCHVRDTEVESTANQIAGLVGNAADNCVIKNSTFEGTVSGGNNVGGICANGYPQIEHCRSAGTIIGKAYVGGIAGSMARGSVRYSYNTAAVTATNSGDAPVGGILGRAQGGSGGVRISCCFNNGEVKSSNSKGSNTGGVIGKLGDETSSVDNCYNAGKVTSLSGTNEAGGIVGIFSGTAASKEIIVNCYNVGIISAPKAAGIAGKIANAANAVSGCYFLATEGLVGVLNGSQNGTSGQSAAAMSDFSTYAGWDPAIWSIKAGYAYPQLNELPHK